MNEQIEPQTTPAVLEGRQHSVLEDVVEALEMVRRRDDHVELDCEKRGGRAPTAVGPRLEEVGLEPVAPQVRDERCGAILDAARRVTSRDMACELVHMHLCGGHVGKGSEPARRCGGSAVSCEEGGEGHARLR